MKTFWNCASSRSRTCAGSPENHIYYRLLKIKPSGGLTEQQWRCFWWRFVAPILTPLSSHSASLHCCAPSQGLLPLLGLRPPWSGPTDHLRRSGMPGSQARKKALFWLVSKQLILPNPAGWTVQINLGISYLLVPPLKLPGSTCYPCTAPDVLNPQPSGGTFPGQAGSESPWGGSHE